VTGIAEKAAHVRAEARKGTGNHTCHWPGCDRRVPPSMWGCKPHWFRLPSSMRNRIWTAYKLGQEISKTPTPEYVAASREAQAWAAQDDRRREMVNRGWTYDL
jgi:hypothetical protein